MTLEQLNVLVRVAHEGSFTRAAGALGVQKSYASRVVAQLEAELGAKLIERTTRTLSLTELGREVVERAVGILSAVEDTRRAAQSAQGEPRGQLRLTATDDFGMLAVAGWIEQYLQRWPQAAVEVEYTSRLIDLVHEGFDLAIRAGTLPETRLVARTLGELEYGLFASPAYLAAAGRPDTPQALRDHALLVFNVGSQRQGWQMAHPGTGEVLTVSGPARLRANNGFALRDAALRGLGIARLPLLVAAGALAERRLVPLLGDWQLPTRGVYAVYPSQRFLSPKVRAFVDLAAERFPQAAAAAREAASRYDAPAKPARPRRSPA